MTKLRTSGMRLRAPEFRGISSRENSKEVEDMQPVETSCKNPEGTIISIKESDRGGCGAGPSGL